MKINDVFATLKVKPRTGWLLIVLAVVTVAAILFLSSGSKKPIPAVAVLKTAQQQMEIQFKNQLKEKDVQIKDYKSRLVVSESKYAILVQKYRDLQKEKENVKPPASNAELRDRFIALGYPPLAAK
jgi:type IV pilus biogenesis protein CpaD/CtpE